MSVPPAVQPAEQDRRWPRVSVLVPTHRREELLARTLAAILDQDYPGPVEVVLTYDQCPVVPGHDLPGAHRCVRVTSNSRTPGLAGARNTGALAARGELVALCDDDDVWLPGKLTRQVRLMLDQGARTCVTGIVVVNGGRRIARVPAQRRLTVGDLAGNRVVAASPSTFLTHRSDLLGPIGLVDEQIPGSYGEDWDWLLRAAAVDPVLVLAEPLVECAWHPGSFFRTRWATIAEALTYLAGKHEALRADPSARAYLNGRVAFARAALGQRRAAADLARRALRDNPRELRAVLALAVCAGLPAGPLVSLASRAGRGL